jgi:hypothetical protein
VATAALGLTLALVAPGVAAADPPVEPHVPPIVGTFHVNPIAVPVGGTLVYQGFCGFPAVEVLPAIAKEVDPFQFVHFFARAPVKPGPFGVFTVAVTVPATGNVGIGGTPITPGGYFATVACIDADGGSVVLPSDFFEVTGSTRGGGGGR